MKNLLVLAHRIPFPPRKGDKLRTYHFLQFLSERYRVLLGAFIDDPDDWQHTGAVNQLCAATHFSKLDPRAAKLRALQGFATGEALTLPYFRDRRMHDWVHRVSGEQPVDHVLVFCSSMAQYLPSDLRPSVRTVIDFIDVDSDKWRQYAASARWPMSWVYGREARKLLRYERRLVDEFDACVFVSSSEADMFKKLTGGRADRITHIDNGVDTEYFSPDREYENPYRDGERAVVFTGAMDYWANVEAVVWFANEVLPLIARRHAAAKFFIVGARPAPEVRSLAKRRGVVVTGSVPDIRPYLAHAAVAVAPLRIARGVQNKVLEAFAMARPMVATPAALEGIACPAHAAVCETPAEFAEQACRYLDAPAANPAGRDCVLSRYSWARNLEKLVDLLEGAPRRECSPSAAGRVA